MDIDDMYKEKAREELIEEIHIDTPEAILDYLAERCSFDGDGRLWTKCMVNKYAILKAVEYARMYLDLIW